jgi:hypothetical protein
MNFEEWLYKVCEIISLKTRQEITDVYSSINLTHAKLSFLDGEAPEEYNNWSIY